MSYFNDPFDRYFRARQRPTRPSNARAVQSYSNQSQGRSSQRPTLDDFNQLVQVYRELQEEHDKLSKKLSNSEEALREQTKKAIELKDERERLKAENGQLRDALEAESSRKEDTDEQSWQERFLRLQAETENYRRRLEQRTIAESQRERHRILEDMLALADHLDMALQHIDHTMEDEEVDEGTAGMKATFRQNIEATLNAFVETLRKHGVQSIDPTGQSFDPNLHEAVGRVDDPETPEDHVSTVVLTGYLVDGKLLRPARVLLSSGPQSSSGS